MACCFIYYVYTQIHTHTHTWNSPGKGTGVGSHSLLQRFFLTQWLNPGLLHCRQILYNLSYQAIPVRACVCVCVCVCMIKYTCIHWALLLPILHGLNTSTFSPHSTDSFSLWTVIPNYSLYWFVSPSPLICIHLQMCSSKNIALLSVPTLSSSSCWPTAFFFISFHLDGIRAIANWTPTVCQALVQGLNV